MSPRHLLAIGSILLSCLACLAAAGSAAAALPDTVVSFTGQPDGTVFGTNDDPNSHEYNPFYDSPGIYSGTPWDAMDKIPVNACSLPGIVVSLPRSPSGGQVLQSNRACNSGGPQARDRQRRRIRATNDHGTGGFVFELLNTRSRFSLMEATDYPCPAPSVCMATLIAYDVHGNQVAQAAGPLLSTFTQLSVTSPDENIDVVVLDSPNADVEYVDNITMDTPDTPPPPFVTLHPAPLTVVDGGTASASMQVLRHNGSAGAVQLDNPTYPPGLSISFDPNPMAGHNATVTVHADKSVPPQGDATYTVTGSPQSSLTGPAPDPAVGHVTILPAFRFQRAPILYPMDVSPCLETHTDIGFIADSSVTDPITIAASAPPDVSVQVSPNPVYPGFSGNTVRVILRAKEDLVPRGSVRLTAQSPGYPPATFELPYIGKELAAPFYTAPEVEVIPDHGCARVQPDGTFALNSPFRLNGLYFSGSNGVLHTVWDTRAHTVRFSEDTDVLQGNQKLSRLGAGTLSFGNGHLFDIPADPHLTFAGLHTTGVVSADLLNAHRIQLTLRVLPGWLFSGGAPLAAEVHYTGNNQDGFHFGGVHFHFGWADLGPTEFWIGVKDVDFRYEPANASGQDFCGNDFFGPAWGASGTFKFPFLKDIEVMAHLLVVNGELRDLGGYVDGIDIPVAPVGPLLLSIDKIGAHLCGRSINQTWRPTAIQGDLGFALGVPEVQPIKFDGSLLIGIPPEFQFDAKGDLAIELKDLFPQIKLDLPTIHLAQAEVAFDRSGTFRLKAHVGFSLPKFLIPVSLVSVDVGVQGAAGGKGFEFSGNGDVCVVICAGGAAIVSNRGIAGCVRVVLIPAVDFGFFKTPEVAGHGRFGIQFHGGIDAALGGGTDCGFDDYRVYAAGDAAVSTRNSFTLKKAEPSVWLHVYGAGAPPAFSLRGPRGRHFDTSETAAQLRGAGAALVPDPGHNDAYFVVAGPSAGRWTLTAHPGTKLSTLAIEVPHPDSRVHATVTGTGSRRTLHYDAYIPAGSAVRFEERGKQSYSPIFVVQAPAAAQGPDYTVQMRHLRGSVTFTPQRGTDRQRSLIYELGHGGMYYSSKTIGSFTAPAVTAPPRPSHVSAKWVRGGLLVTWRSVPDAVGYEAVGGTADGTRLAAVAGPTGRSVVLALPRGWRAVVNVRARNVQSMFGPAGSFTLKGRRH